MDFPATKYTLLNLYKHFESKSVFHMAKVLKVGLLAEFKLRFISVVVDSQVG